MNIHFNPCEDALKRRRKHLDVGAVDQNDCSRTARLWRLGASSSSFVEYVKTVIALPYNDTTFGDEKRVTLKRSSSNLSLCLARQVRGMTQEFQSSGLPWKGPQCRSVISGCSGVLFCLPVFFCKNSRLDQFNWVVQALLSVMADYVCIVGDSWVHGVDRFFATANLLAIITRAVFALNITALTMAVIPVSTFILANRAKQQLDLQGWIFYHFLWHLTASAAVTVTMHLLFACPDYNRDDSNFESPLYSLCG